MTAPPQITRKVAPEADPDEQSAVPTTAPSKRKRRTLRHKSRPSGKPHPSAGQRAYARRASRRSRWATAVPLRLPRLASRTSFVVLIIALLGAGVFASLLLTTWAAQDSRNLEIARDASVQLSDKVEQLKQQVADLNSPDGLQQRARQLGMVPAPDAVILSQNSDGSVNVIGTPTRASAPPPPPAPPTPTTTATPTTSPPTTMPALTSNPAPTTTPVVSSTPKPAPSNQPPPTSQSPGAQR